MMLTIMLASTHRVRYSFFVVVAVVVVFFMLCVGFFFVCWSAHFSHAGVTMSYIPDVVIIQRKIGVCEFGRVSRSRSDNDDNDDDGLSVWATSML